MKQFLKFFSVALLICCFSLLTWNSPIYADTEEKNVDVLAPSKAMAVMEGNTYQLLYGSAENMKLPMASTTKITTCIVAIENAKDLNEMVKIDDHSVGIEGTSIYLKKGEEMPLKDLLLGLMLASGNDASVAIAYHIGGTEENFVRMMNDYVQSIGATNTHYDNPHGLDSDTHYTTAKDLALITSHALQNDIFREIVSTKFATIQGNDEVKARYLKNKNRILFEDEDCIGVKTGFTDNAGRCLVNAYDKNGMRIVSVVLNCGPMFEECTRLTNLAIQEYEMVDFIQPYTYVGSVAITSGDKENMNLVTIVGFRLPVKKTEKDLYEVKVDIPTVLNAPVEKNQVVGSISVYYKGESIYTGEVYTIDESKNLDFRYTLDNILQRWYN